MTWMASPAATVRGCRSRRHGGEGAGGVSDDSDGGVGIDATPLVLVPVPLRAADPCDETDADVRGAVGGAGGMRVAEAEMRSL